MLLILQRNILMLLKTFCNEFSSGKKYKVTLCYYELKGGFHTFIIRHVKNFIHRFWNIHFVLLYDSLVTKKAVILVWADSIFYWDYSFLPELICWFTVGFVCWISWRPPHTKRHQNYAFIALSSSSYTWQRTNTRWKNSRGKAHQLKSFRSAIKLFKGKKGERYCLP